MASEASQSNRLTAAGHEYDTQQFEGGFARQKCVALVLVYDFRRAKKSSSIFAFILRMQSTEVQTLGELHMRGTTN